MTLVISIFILILQFFWVYIDDLMGKGIDIIIILELLFYVSASLIPLALPLSILISSLMTFGNFSENNELTALKSSGLSLYKIMRPLTIFVISLAIFTFYFSNYVIPVANLKWHALIYDIQNTKISSLIKPGVYTKEIDGYAIKVGSGANGRYKDIIIHDHTTPTEIKTIKAEELRIYKSTNSLYLFLELINGNVFEELDIQNPIFLPDGKVQNRTHLNRPSRISTFKKATYKINISGFSLQRSDSDIFKDKYEMLNVFQISSAMDSLDIKEKNMQNAYEQANKRSGTIFNIKNIEDDEDTLMISPDMRAIQSGDIGDLQLTSIHTKLVDQLRRKNTNLKNQINYLSTIMKEETNYWIEFHRKFALSFTLIVLFFIGAPLGSIIRKGGFGAPMVVAAIIFIIYFSIITTGENLVQSYVISPFTGMWMACIIFTPIAILLSRSAAKDSILFSKENWIKLFKIKPKKDEPADS
ncbi:MAG: LptF/LptG family permease [Crocinitomicaceae bacterium]|nr:LptF/LptG family permease [Crocinitomicaceae bacterium]